MLTLILDTLLGLLRATSLYLAFVLTLYLIQKLVCGLATRRIGSRSIFVTAITGTPVHEISHLLICKIFFHRINKICFFKCDGSGTLGYVEHSYNPSNPWQVIGNFFIGIAPLLGGTAAILLLTHAMLPESDKIISNINDNIIVFSNKDNIQGASSFVTHLVNACASLFQVLYSTAKSDPLVFCVWAYLTASISIHMSPSPADMKGGIKGGVLLIALLVVIQFTSEKMAHELFFHLENTLLALSVGYSLCVLLAFTLAILIYLLSLFYPYRQIA